METRRNLFIDEFNFSAFFDPTERLKEEMTEVMRVTNSDVLPGLEKIPWKDDAETWLETPNPEPPWNDVPEEDFVSKGKIYPLQSNIVV